MAATPIEQSRAFRSFEKAAGKLGFRTFEEGAAKTFCLICAAVSIIVTVGIVVILVTEAIPFFQKTSLAGFLTGLQWTPSAPPENRHFGIIPLLTGTMMITVGSGIVAIPLGLLVGIYLAEYAHFRVRRILKPTLELLAGIPSVVFGYFALNLVTPGLRGTTDFLAQNLPFLKPILPQFSPANAAAGAIVVGFMTLPLVASLCEDAITSVPKQLREAAYGLGFTKAEVITKIAVPAAFSGIIASFILALSRAVGETMAVTIAAGATPKLTMNPADEIMTMTAQIVNFSKGDISRGDIQYQSIFAIGLLLFLLTFVMNLWAMRVVRKVGRHAR